MGREEWNRLIGRIRRCVSLEQLASTRYGIKVRQRGRGYVKMLCPFHNDHNPSLSIKMSTNRFTCFGCGARGDVFEFVMKKELVSFRKAVDILLNWDPANRFAGLDEATTKEKDVA